MARQPIEPLTADEAKHRLRRAANRLSLDRLIADRPGEAVVVALAAGVILGGSPNLRRLLSGAVMQYLNRR